MLSAETLHQRGLEASNAGRHTAARRLLTRAAERAGDEPDLLARIEGSLAYVEAELGRPQEALALCEQALARPEVSRRTKGVVTSQRGLLAMRRGDTRMAIRDLTTAIGQLDDDPVLEGRLRINRGNVHLQRGDVALAESDFATAREVLSAVEEPVLRAKATHNHGYALLLRGDLIGALRDMEDAAEVLAPLSVVSQAVGDQDRAEVLIAAGLAEQGVAALGLAARSYASRRLVQFQGEAELVRARTLLTVDPGLARRVARHAARRFRARGSEAWALRADAVAVMAEVASGRTSPGVVEAADLLVPRLREHRLFVDASLVGLSAARALTAVGDAEQARRRLRSSRLPAAAPIGARLLERRAWGDLERLDGRPRHSFGHLRRGLTELHTWQSSFGSLDLQSGVAGHGRELALAGLALAVDDGRPSVVLEWSERTRSVASRVTPVRPPRDEAASAALSELRVLQAQEPAPGSAGERRMVELRRQVRELSWRGDGSHDLARPCSLAELQAGLGPDTALVAHVTSPYRLTALVVTQRRATVRALGQRSTLAALLGGLRADLDLASADLPARLAASVRDPLRWRLVELGGLLIDPVADLVGDRSVVLTPSARLAGIPWGCLPGLAGRSVTVAQSATGWLARRSTPLRLGSAGFVAGPRVPRAEAEVLDAARIWGGAKQGSVLSGPAATAAAVARLAGRVDVLHLAAHGRHSAESPLFSGVELVDGPWYGYDIEQVAPVPDVVLLSACEVGRSQVRHGAELLGMTAAWQHAGVRSVVAAVAAVNDAVAHDVLVGVHRGLRAGLDPAEALRSATASLPADGPPCPLVAFS